MTRFLIQLRRKIMEVREKGEGKEKISEKKTLRPLAMWDLVTSLTTTKEEEE